MYKTKRRLFILINIALLIIISSISINVDARKTEKINDCVIDSKIKIKPAVLPILEISKEKIKNQDYKTLINDIIQYLKTGIVVDSVIIRNIIQKNNLNIENVKTGFFSIRYSTDNLDELKLINLISFPGYILSRYLKYPGPAFFVNWHGLNNCGISKINGKIVGDEGLALLCPFVNLDYYELVSVFPPVKTHLEIKASGLSCLIFSS